MSETYNKTYDVSVWVTYTFKSTVQVKADSPSAAREIAVDAYECDWSDAVLTDEHALATEVTP
jgi:hypothetical protein